MQIDVVSVLHNFVNYEKIHRQLSQKAECDTYQINCSSKCIRNSEEGNITFSSFNQGKSFPRGGI